MSYRAAYLDEGRGAIRLGEGVILGADLVTVAKKQNEHLDKLFPIRYFIVDLLAVTDFQVLPDDIYELAELNALMNPYFAREPLVLILAGDKLGVAISRFWQTVASDLYLRVHLERTKQNALEWVQTVWVEETRQSLENFPDLVNYLQGNVITILFMDEKSGQ